MGADNNFGLWIDLLRSEYGRDGFLFKARQGIFDAGRGEALHDALAAMELPSDDSVDRQLERRFVAYVWYIPIALERQTERLTRRGSDVWRYRRLVSRITRAIYHILSCREPVLQKDEGEKVAVGSHDAWVKSVRETNFPEVTIAIFGKSLLAHGLRLKSADETLVRYESASVYVNVRQRQYALRPELELGRLSDPPGHQYDLREIIEAFVGIAAAAPLSIALSETQKVTEYLKGLEHLLTAHCGQLLQGDLDHFRRLDDYAKQRNRELSEKILGGNQGGGQLS